MLRSAPRPGTADGRPVATERPRLFAEVTVDHEAGIIVWPGGIDLAPEPLYEQPKVGTRGASEPQEHGVKPHQAQRLTVELAHLAEYVGLLDPLDDLAAVDPDVVEEVRLE